MTTEEKKLLLADLCARLPYGVIVNNSITGDDDVLTYSLLEDFEGVNFDYPKPYLRPMDSMTEEEYDQLYIDSRIKEDSIDILDALANDMDAIDWLNANHFDYRGLIEKGLALVAPEGTYK